MTTKDAIRVLITGCSSGTGRALAAEMDRRGYHVIATARHVEALSDLHVAERLTLDLTDAASIADAVANVGRVDILVNNAGLGLRAPVEVAPLPIVRELFETMFFGPLLLIQGVLPGMRARKSGLIVNVSSGMAAPMVRPLSSFYSAAKLALEAMSEGMSYELRSFGVRVLIIQPGNIVTNFRPAMRSFGEDGPYAELVRGIERWRARAQRTELKTEASDFARDAVDAIETNHEQLRVAVGADAVAALRSRRAQTDEEFREVVLREFVAGDASDEAHPS